MAASADVLGALVGDMHPRSAENESFVITAGDGTHTISVPATVPIELM